MGRVSGCGEYNRNRMQFAGHGNCRRDHEGKGKRGLLARTRQSAAVHGACRRNATDGVVRSGCGHLFISRHSVAMMMRSCLAHSVARCPTAGLHAGSSQQRRRQRKNQCHSRRDGNQTPHFGTETISLVYAKSKNFLIDSSLSLTV
jgi:hypothetical protein